MSAPRHDPLHDVRLLASADEMVAVSDLLQLVWGTPGPIVNAEMLIAITHSGGYVSGAFDRHGAMVGASVAFLARHRGLPALHSHVTGLRAERRGTGLGRALKVHQREWASGNGVEWITWTFDPLVRRNAWFNIAVLGVEVDAYLPAFYGTMSDAINDGDESDRLHVAWDVRAPLDDDLRDGSSTSAARLVPTPDDIVTLRRTDPEAVARWRRDTRESLSTALDAGHPIVGFTTDGHYVIGTNA